MKMFSFYLDAWKYCSDRDIDPKRIIRVDWKHWSIKGTR